VATTQVASEPVVQSTPEPSLDVGDTFKLGGFAYTITDVEYVQSIGSRFMKTKASEGAVFVIVAFSIENLGKETETVLSDDFKMIDTEDRTFRASSGANTALAMTGNKDLLLSEIQPGLSKKSSTAFEVPLASAEEGLTLVIPEKGLLGTKEVRVYLPLLKKSGGKKKKKNR
jgi:hypothetical protein